MKRAPYKAPDICSAPNRSSTSSIKDCGSKEEASVSKVSGLPSSSTESCMRLEWNGFSGEIVVVLRGILVLRCNS